MITTINPNSVAGLLGNRARFFPADKAFSFPEIGQQYTWQTLDQDVTRLGKGLIQLGIKKGQKVAVVMQGCTELITILLATTAIGAIAVPLNTYSKSHELKVYLADAKPDLLIVANASKQNHTDNVQQLVQQGGTEAGFLPRHIFAHYTGGHTGTLPALKLLFDLGNRITRQEFVAACNKTDLNDPAFLLYTSGTTGIPKGVMRSAASFLSAKKNKNTWVARVADRLINRFTNRFKLINLLPLYHIGGLGVIFTALKGANVQVIMLTHFNPVAAYNVASGQKCHIIIGTPFMVQYMLNNKPANGANLDSVWGVVFTSAATSRNVVEQVIGEFKNLSFFMVSYGSSESGSVANGTCFVNSSNMAVNLLISLMRRINVLSGEISYQHFLNTPYSIGGRIDKSVEVKTINPDTLEFLHGDQPGEIVVKSHRVMKYTDEQLTTASTLAGGWFRSGDIGFIDEHGYLIITDRIKRMISRGGEKISPAEVENKLLQHPAIVQAYVLGMPDELYGEQVCAAYVTASHAKIDETELIAQLSQSLSSFKVPRYFVHLPGFELSSTGKIASAQMKQLILSKLANENCA